MTRQLNNDNGLQGRRTEGQLITAPTKNWRFSASYDIFVVNQTLVFQIKFCDKSPALRVAANRYAMSLKSDSVNINFLH